MRKRFKSFIEENQLIQPKAKILLAVSGGVDSMVMLHLFHECGYNFAVAHCNFSLRGAESDADEQLVRDITTKLGVQLFVTRFNTIAYSQEREISIQVAARELRYSWFESVCHDNDFQLVAVAHNKNDIAETILINLCRGTGLRGLTGIKPITNGIIRPLLFALRQQIEEYADINGISYRTDSSNSNTKYARNRIRHNILPEMEQINEGVIENLYGTSLFLSESWQAIEKLNNEFKNEVLSVLGDELHYSIEKLLAYPFKQIFLVEELTELGFPASMVIDIEKSLLTQSGKTFYASEYMLIRDRESLIVSPIKTNQTFEVEIDQNTSSINEPIALEISVIDSIENFTIPKSTSVGVFSFDKILFPLKLRPWREGDWFIPFGMKGRKKISDFLIDQKIPIHQKQDIYVIESNGDIIWVVGHRIDNRYRISENSNKVFLVRMVMEG